MCERAARELQGFPGLRVTVEHDDLDYLIPRTVLNFTDAWTGLSRNEVSDAMGEGRPRIRLYDIFDPWELAIDPLNLTDEELDIVIFRLRKVLGSS